MTDIHSWLADNQFQKYAESFAVQEISIDQVAQLTDADLQGLGFATLGERKRFQKAADRGTGPNAPLSSAPGESSSASILTAPARNFEEGERRHATVMFSDLTGYTALNEAFDPEEVEAIMARIKGEAVAAIERYGGRVNQFVGDEVMAIFGVPVARGDDPMRAVRAALDLHKAVDAIAAGLAQQLGRIISMHSGIQSGLVVARRGDSRAGDYTLTGDAVNTAARLRSLAGPGELIISQQTWNQVSDHFEGEAGAPIALKGKERALVPWRIVKERALPRVGGHPLVGRTDEKQQFSSVAIACAQRKQGGVVLVRGDPGMGKSRLCAEFLELAREYGLVCHDSVILDFGARTGLDAMRRIVQSLLGLAADSNASSSSDAIAALSRIGAASHAPFLYDLLDVAAPEPVRALLSAMSVAARQNFTLDALRALAHRSAECAPILILLEDINWADAWTLRQLGELAALTDHEPLLMVMSTRFAGDPSRGEWRCALKDRSVTNLDLGPLAADDALRLVAGSAMSEHLLRSCVERADGNPLFLHQLVLNAVEEETSQLPGSIQALIQARMDRLSPRDKSALQAAAVWGSRVPMVALRHLLGDPSFEGTALVDHFLLRPNGDDFEFSHALIRDGAYGSLLHSRRRELHIAAAQWVEAADIALAAEHYERAQDERAAQAYLLASDALSDVFKYAEALALVERGLPLSDAQPVQFRLRLARVRLRLENARAADAVDAGPAALEVSQSGGERALALLEIAAGMRVLDRLADGLTLLEQAQPLLEQAGMTHELSRLHHLRGNLLYGMDRATECQLSHELALEFATRAGSVEAQVNAMGGIGDALYAQGRIRTAHDVFTRCVALAREHRLLRVEVSYLTMLEWTSLYQMDIAGSVAASTAGIELALRISHWRSEMILRAQRAVADGWYLGNVKNALPQLDRVLEIVRAVGMRRTEALSWTFHGLLALREGNLEAARAHAACALDLEGQIGLRSVGAPVFGVLARAEHDAVSRRKALATGEAILGQGAPVHSHIMFYDLAIEASLGDRQWDEAERYCALFDAYAAAEPFTLSRFVTRCGRAMSRVGRGETGADLLVELQALRQQAHDTQCFVYVERIDMGILRATR
jgi:class 3 adenylate cyclase/tetratricopeptide (TPR) repeat protein